MTLRKGYSSADLKLDLANLYQKTGLKNLGTVFLMTDAQVADEKFLVLINNLLASGEIPDLFSDDEVENIVTMVRNEVKGAGLQDTKVSPLSNSRIVQVARLVKMNAKA